MLAHSQSVTGEDTSVGPPAALLLPNVVVGPPPLRHADLAPGGAVGIAPSPVSGFAPVSQAGATLPIVHFNGGPSPIRRATSPGSIAPAPPIGAPLVQRPAPVDVRGLAPRALEPDSSAEVGREVAASRVGPPPTTILSEAILAAIRAGRKPDMESLVLGLVVADRPVIRTCFDTMAARKRAASSPDTPGFAVLQAPFRRF